VALVKRLYAERKRRSKHFLKGNEREEKALAIGTPRGLIQFLHAIKDRGRERGDGRECPN